MKNPGQETTTNNEKRTCCEVWTRVMGYFRPVDSFNKGKQSEYSERTCYSEKLACKNMKK